MYVQDVAVDVDVVQDIHHVRKQNARTQTHNGYTYVPVAAGQRDARGVSTTGWPDCLSVWLSFYVCVLVCMCAEEYC